MAWLEEVIQQLEAEAVGTFGANIFATSKAVVPVLVSGFATLHVVETGGSSPDYTHNSVIRPAVQMPGAQLVSRADEYNEAMAMARAAYNALVRVRNQTIGSGFYQNIRAEQEPLELGLDDRKQVRIAFNVIGKRSQV